MYGVKNIRFYREDAVDFSDETLIVDYLIVVDQIV
jgi:hypothetical protein